MTDSKKKVLLIIDHFGSGGAQRQMLSLARGLTQRGIWVEIFRYYDINHYKNQLSGLNIPIHTHHKNTRIDISPVFALRKVARDKDFDATVSFLDTPNLYNELGTLGLASKVIVSERSTQRPGESVSFLQRLRRRAHSLADTVVVNSHTQRDFLRNEFAIPSAKITVIYNGVDTALFFPKSKSRQPGANTSTRLLAVGRVDRPKNALTLIRAMHKALRGGTKPFSIDWAGRIHDRDYYQECVQLLNYYRITSFRWIGEIKNIDTIYHNYSALVHPSIYEGFPNVIAEAMACGLPVLASSVCDHPLIVRQHQNGLLFDPYNADDLARALNEYMSMDQDEVRHLRSEALVTAADRFSFNRFVDQFEALL